MSGNHAFCSPSGYVRWSRCAGSAALEEYEPDNPNPASLAGDRIHAALAALFKNAEPLEGKLKDEELEIAQTCEKWLLARIEAYRAEGARVYCRFEEKVDISWITGEDGAQGSADVVLIIEWSNRTTVEVVDHKSGYHEVPVVENPQLAMYAAASLRMPWAPKGSVDEVGLVVFQPRVHDTPQEWFTTTEWLDGFCKKTYPLAQRCLSLRNSMDAYTALNPDENEQCRFCRHAWRCDALTELVQKNALADFDQVLAPLSDREAQIRIQASFALVERVETWCKAVRRAALLRMVVQRKPVAGLKTVQGRAGNRAWADEELAEATLLLAGVPGVHSKPKLKTPAQLEKTLKAMPTVWAAVKGFITQASGKVSVVAASDPRPEYTGDATIDDFEDES